MDANTKIAANDRAQENYFGRAVDIDGDYAVISATYDSRNSLGVADKTRTGSAYVFKNNAGTWTQTQKFWLMIEAIMTNLEMLYRFLMIN